MSVYVLVHGAWHTGDLLSGVAASVRGKGHQAHCPTLAGNRPGDSKKTGLEEAIQSLVDYIDLHRLKDIILMGHSYGGMVISGAADRLAGRIRRLVYWNAMVPLNGDALYDLVPPHYVELFNMLAAESGDGSLMLPFAIWREAFFNDGDYAQAKAAYEMLNPHPVKTFTDRIVLKTELAASEIGKSYLNCLQDTAMPHSFPWHPRLSERLGLFRLVEMPGGHEVCFTNPGLLAEKIMEAGRD